MHRTVLNIVFAALLLSAASAFAQQAALASAGPLVIEKIESGWLFSPDVRATELVFGLGYRAVGNAPLLGDQLDGVSGSISYQIGGK